MRPYFLSLLVAGLCLSSCRKSGAPVSTGVPSLEGNWRWVIQYNDGMFSGNYTGNPTGDTLTPQSTGVQEFLNMTADGSYAVVDNGATVQSGWYKIDTMIVPGPLNGGGAIGFLAFVRPGQPDSLVNHAIYGDTLAIFTMQLPPNGPGIMRKYVKVASEGLSN